MTLTGCFNYGNMNEPRNDIKTSDTADDTDNTGITGETNSLVMEKITAEQAKEMMDQQEDIIILDVRTTQEFNSGHIEGAVLIPDYELAEVAEEQLKDKDAIILIYCRSGNRSAQAANTLQELGYTNLYDFGGIIDWPFDIIK
ncbi:rhodanese-like domain-containing protein [Mobilitalea sibirica]|uniref:Rhodanese-like domain-containing protein n=2 Tax=Mobilitalea sibirica TaxID=1462919 RepID=A0A8J7H075_9FIRM|nr:rhodanese-like domain-containing protein [Mobilitalea sibirica]